MLTVRDRIIVHLSALKSFADDFECPKEMCQSGISEVLGKSRAHVTLELNRMVADGLVSERIAHVHGEKSRRKTYSLTSIGISKNAEIEQHLDTLQIHLHTEGKDENISGSNAVDSLCAKFKMSRAAAVESVLECGGTLNLDIQEGAAQGMHGTCCALPPRPETFIARKELGELAEMLEPGQAATTVLLGIPGIGKTSLLSEFARTISQKPVFYRRLYSFDSANSVLASLGKFFADAGSPALQRYLANTESIDLSEVSVHISRFAEGHDCVLMLDEYGEAISLDPLLSMFASVLNGTGSRMFVASAVKPGFYSKRDAVVEKRVHEIKLAPLGKKEMLALAGPLLSESDIAVANGHPLTLRLIAAGLGKSGLAEYVETDMLARDSNMAKLCRFASVLRRPFEPEDLELMGFEAAAEIKSHLVFEAQPGGGFLLHPAISSILASATGRKMARELHRTAAKFYLDDDNDIAEGLHHLIEAEDFDDAREATLAHSDNMASLPNQDELARCLGTLADRSPGDWTLLVMAASAFDRAGKWKQAEELAGRVETGAQGTALAYEAALLRSNILSKTGRTSTAIKNLDRLIKAGIDPGMDVLAKAHYIKTCALRKSGKNSLAQKECEKALSSSLMCGNRLLHAQCLMESAMIMSAQGRNEEAFDMLGRASVTFAASGNTMDRIRCKINTGMVLKNLGRTSEAADEIEYAIKMADETGLSRIRAHGMANLTEILNIMKNYQRSEALAREAAGIFSELGEPVMLAVSKFNLGNALAGLGKKAEAARTLEDALSILDENGLTESRSQWVLDSATVFDSMGDTARAEAVRRKVN